jgi:hypothetical protein
MLKMLEGTGTKISIDKNPPIIMPISSSGYEELKE